MQTNHINTLQIETLEAEIWAQLQRARVDKHHEWRSPVLVTNGLAIDLQANWPDARTVILRGVNLTTKQLTFYTDSRSPKVAQLQANAKAMLVFWSKRLNWQLRVKVTIKAITEGEQLQKIWQKVSQSQSAGDYLSLQSPGELFDNTINIASQMSQNKVHFALLIADVVTIDWLALGREGHQRAKFDSEGFHQLAP